MVITWTVGLTARPGRENSFIAIANELTETSNRLDEGCDIYICLQNLDDPRDFLWYEQWATMPLLERHVERIQPMLAGSPEGPQGSRLYTSIQRREQLGYDLLRNHINPERDWYEASITGWAVARAKPGREGDLRELAVDLSRTGQEFPGNVTHIAHEREDVPGLICWFEQWRDQDVLDARVASLEERYGPPPGTEGVERMPAGIADVMESLEATRYRVVAT